VPHIPFGYVILSVSGRRNSTESTGTEELKYDERNAVMKIKNNEPESHPLLTDEGAAFFFRLFFDSPCPPSQHRIQQHIDSTRTGARDTAVAGLCYFYGINNRIVLSDSVIKQLQRYYAGQLARYTAVERTGNDIIEKLRRSGIDARVFKGTDIARRLYPWPELRCFKDIDILIDPSHAAECRTILESEGWELVASMYIHDVYRKAGVLLEVHTSLFGHGESILFGCTRSDIHRYISHTVQPEEEYRLLTMKLFTEPEIDKMKLLDLYLFRTVYNLKGMSIPKRWDGTLTMQLFDACIDNYAGKKTLKSTVSVMILTGRLCRVWQAIKYPFLLCSVPARCRKIRSILFPPPDVRRKIYGDSDTSSIRHIRRMIRVFTGRHHVKPGTRTEGWTR
jgi:hypothetical protein